ncbi:MAG: hypothetical protein IPM25_16630 [Chloracidobacterium sp.]|nr:hypothetical protein [Chloracidobacterium sp.]
MSNRSSNAAVLERPAAAKRTGRSVPARRSGFNKAEFERKLAAATAIAGNAVNLAFEKAVAHINDPAKYPLPTSGKSVERAFFDFLQTLSKGDRKRAIEQVDKTRKASPSQRAAIYKDLIDLDLSSKVPIAEQAVALKRDDSLRFSEAEVEEVLKRVGRLAHKPTLKAASPVSTAKAKAAVPRGGVPARKVTFLVDRLTCNKTDDLRRDEISIAGFGFDTNGTDLSLSPLFVGKFKDGESVALGASGRLFSFDIDDTVASQSFTATIFIIEDDLIKDRDRVLKLSKLLFAITIALGVVAGGLLIASIANPALFPAYIAVLLTGGILGFAANRIVPMMGPDISLAVDDTLLVEKKLDAGDEFARALTMDESLFVAPKYKGSYSASARWLAEE